MSQPFHAVVPRGELQSATLAQVVSLPLEGRYASILQFGRNDLIGTLHRLRDEGAPLPLGLDAERLAWAIAFNVEGPSTPSIITNSIASRGSQGYQDRWSPDVPWSLIWSTLGTTMESKSPATGKSGVTTLLAELALSVACEQRNDWQNPSSRPIEMADVNRAFEFVYASNHSKVVGDLYGAFGSRAGSPESIAQEAWSRVFVDYWSATARRRFLGTSRISTLVCQVARHVGYDTFRSVGVRSGPQIESLVEVLGIDINPLGQMMAQEVRDHIRECARHLPAKQQVVATMVWFREMPAKRAAEVLRVSEPAVSQLLKKAVKALRICLGGHGFPCAEED
jgi:RNA polymerase sigma factor (sigma-70 family)